MVVAGSLVKFRSSLSNGGYATWNARVVKIENGIAFVRHPRSARTFPFSPVSKPGLYKYEASKLRAKESR